MVAEKTYSGVQAYHEMLIRAQASCPALTYILCKYLLEAQIKKEKYVVKSAVISVGNPEHVEYFDHSNERCSMTRFVGEIFGKDKNVQLKWDDANGYRKQFQADIQLVRWLQSGVVHIDHEQMLVTIKL